MLFDKRRFGKRLPLGIFVLLVPLFFSCSLRRIAVKQTGAVIEKGLPVFFSEGDLPMAESALSANIKLLEILLETAPKDRRLLLAASQALTAYAFGFVEPEFDQYRYKDWQRAQRAKNRAKALYWRAKVYAQRGLQTRSGTRKIVRAEAKALQDFSATLEKVKKRQIPLLFWYGFSWGGYINLSKDDIAAINNIPKVEQIMKKVIELDENYFHGFAHMFLGIYYGSRPKMLGGNARWSAQHFDRVDEINQNKMLMSKVLRAQYLATQELDEDLFHRLLKEVREAPADLYPEQQLLNQLAKKRAKILQENAEELF